MKPISDCCGEAVVMQEGPWGQCSECDGWARYPVSHQKEDSRGNNHEARIYALEQWMEQMVKREEPEPKPDDTDVKLLLDDAWKLIAYRASMTTEKRRELEGAWMRRYYKYLAEESQW